MSMRNREQAKHMVKMVIDSDTMTSDLQNRTLNFSVLLFPHLKLGVIIQTSDINWVWSP